MKYIEIDKFNLVGRFIKFSTSLTDVRSIAHCSSLPMYLSSFPSLQDYCGTKCAYKDEKLRCLIFIGDLDL